MSLDPNKAFGKEHAASYDDRWSKMAPVNRLIHLLTEFAFARLAVHANILCVGAGTGAEALALATRFTGWKFTLVEPSESMLEVCRKKLEAAGLLARCDLHNGYVDSLPSQPRYHGATSILVSQFLVEKSDRRSFFQQIRKRLLPRGILVSADLATPEDPDRRAVLGDLWVRSMEYAGLTPEIAKASMDGWNKGVAVLPPKDIDALLQEAGFSAVAQVFQSLFIHGWVAENPTPASC